MTLQARDGQGTTSAVVLTRGEHEMLADVAGGSGVVFGEMVLGVRQRYMAAYYPKAIVGDAFDAKATVGDAKRPEIIPVGKAGEMRFRIVAGGKPAAEVQVTVLHPDGGEKKVITDGEGMTEIFTAGGRYGVWARCTEAMSGEHGGKRYEEVRRYPTLVIDVPQPPTPGTIPGTTPGTTPGTIPGTTPGLTPGPTPEGAATTSSPQSSFFAPLPETVSSFGAAVSDGWLYVYGGHKARTHSYSVEAVSSRLHRLKLSEGRTWQALPGGPPVQGMNLAAYAARCIASGGCSR